jgi:hypothetical protein
MKSEAKLREFFGGLTAPRLRQMCKAARLSEDLPDAEKVQKLAKEVFAHREDKIAKYVGGYLYSGVASVIAIISAIFVVVSIKNLGAGARTAAGALGTGAGAGALGTGAGARTAAGAGALGTGAGAGALGTAAAAGAGACALGAGAAVFGIIGTDQIQNAEKTRKFRERFGHEIRRKFSSTMTQRD